MPQNFNEAFRLNRKIFPQNNAAVELVTKAGIPIHNDKFQFDSLTGCLL